MTDKRTDGRRGGQLHGQEARRGCASTRDETQESQRAARAARACGVSKRGAFCEGCRASMAGSSAAEGACRGSKLAATRIDRYGDVT